MATQRRAREWINRTDLLTPAASGQADVAISTALFNKGCTVVRILLDVDITPVTLGVPVGVYVAVWVGTTGSVPADISQDTNQSYMMWTRLVIRLNSGEGQDQFVHRTFDLRGMRRAREDNDDIYFIARADSASAVNVYTASRVLCLLH